MAQTFAIGIAGTENSHAEAIIDQLNCQESGQRARVVALAGGATDRNRKLAELGSIPTVVDDSKELLGSVDALIVTTRDGRLHREQAAPFLESGIPVWVDKPLACSVSEAKGILGSASAGGTQVVSYSPVRWVQDTDDLESAAAEVGEPQAVTVTGPADPSSEYAGIFFYGIHIADVARRLAPGPIGGPRVRRVAHTVIATYDTQGPAVTLEFVEPESAARVPFRATVVGRHGIATRELRLGEGYVRPGIDAFLSMLATGNVPLTSDEMLDPISVLEEIAASLSH